MARPPLPAPSRPAGHPPLSRRTIPGNGSPAKPHDADLPESPPGPVNGLRPPDKESSALPFPSPLMSASPSLPLWDRPPLASAQTAPPPGVRPDGRPRWPTALRAGRPSRRRSGGSARAMRQATSRIRGWRPRPFPHAGGEIGPGDGILEPEPQRRQGTAQAPEALRTPPHPYLPPNRSAQRRSASGRTASGSGSHPGGSRPSGSSHSSSVLQLIVIYFTRLG
jgi:hypothetical protein